MNGQSFGLSAKVDAAVSRDSQRNIERQVEQAIGNAEQTVSPGFEGRTRGGGRGGMLAGAGAGAAGGGLAGRALGGIAAAGAGAAAAATVMGTVFLGGVVATGMLKALQGVSGRAKATLSILNTAMKLFFKPFGDFLGQLLRPMAKALLDFAVWWNNTMSPKMIAMADAIVEGFSLDALLDWSKYINPISWPMFIVELLWTDWLSKVNWGDWLSGAIEFVKEKLADVLNFISNAWPGWPDLSLSGIENTISGFETTLQQVIDWLNTLPFVNINTNKNKNKNTTTNEEDPSDEFADPRLPDTGAGSNRPSDQPPSFIGGGSSRTGIPTHGADASPPATGPGPGGTGIPGAPRNMQPNVNVEVEGYRLGDVTQDERNSLLRRL